ncbi:hypothetical protein [Caballeronia sp. M23-90]
MTDIIGSREIAENIFRSLTHTFFFNSKGLCFEWGRLHSGDRLKGYSRKEQYRTTDRVITAFGQSNIIMTKIDAR